MTFFYAETASDVAAVRGIAAGVHPDSSRANASAVSWGAVLAGAAAAAALSLILLMLGVGLGLSSVSPWALHGASAASFGVSTILWVTLTQLIASAMGGYLAGRLRTKWAGAQADEVFFRDTAHGLLAWAVATLATAALLTSVIGSIVGAGVQAGATMAGGVTRSAAALEATQPDGEAGPMAYFVDSLFRKGVNAPATADDAPRAEVSRIFMTTIRTGPLPAEDIQYVGQLVVQRTGLSQPEAEKRVTDTYTRAQTKLTDALAAAKDAADKARKASAHAALWLFISLLIAAFVASYAATFGGRLRDA